MKQINLLPKRISLKIQRKRIWFWLSMVILFGLGNGTLGWLWAKEQVATFDSQLKSWQEKEREQKEQQMKLALTADADFRQRVINLNELSGKEVNWSEIFKLSGSLIPQDIRLNSLSSLASQSAGTVAFSLNGEAPSNLSFAVFHQSLQNNPDLKSLKVDSYSYTPATGKVNFVLTVALPTTKVTYQQ